MDIIYQLPDIIVFIIMAFFTISFSLLFIIMNKIFKFYKLRYIDNTTTASVASLIGIIYGVLAGFICLYLLTNNDNASRSELDEGSAVSDIYRDSKWLKQPYQKNIQRDIKKYITSVIQFEWPAMGLGIRPDKTNDYLINKISNDLITYPIKNLTDSMIINNIKLEINTLFKGRQYRISMIDSQLSPGIWCVILLSTGLIIVINYAFRVNFNLHIFSLTAFAIMAASILFLLATLDRPFAGEFLVKPDTFSSVLDLIKHDTKL